uniref:PREDICTED: copia proteinlike putative n=1 Tax=Albugo laibachii Nc14 TaxID=890382 RepID=F0WKV8_9STRA|nr:PREDICTED: copia proteinlike putative [Albugo laibachii Nc14]|eukprot:CCA21916.1 PREDICTED: copia proteinlike putative [Albugo laibachii Nc14]
MGWLSGMNRTLVEMTRCMLSESKMSKVYWCEAMMTALDIRNMSPSASSPEASPFEIVFKRKPRIELMRVFGSLCYAHVAKVKRSKLDDSGVRCLLLGYSKQHKAYRLLNASTGAIVISRSVTFAESATTFPRRVNTPGVIDVVGDGEQDQDMHDESTRKSFHTPPTGPRPDQTQDIPELSEIPTGAIPKQRSGTPGRDGKQESHVRPVRKKQAITRYEQEFPSMRQGEAKIDEDDYDALYCFNANEEGESASSYEQVLKSNYKVEWMRAMRREIKSLAKHETWTLEDLPKNR